MGCRDQHWRSIVDDQMQRLIENLKQGCIDFKDRQSHCFDDPLRTSPASPASLLGGYSVCAPPDPIPNSAVKPDCADGTIAQAMEE